MPPYDPERSLENFESISALQVNGIVRSFEFLPQSAKEGTIIRTSDTQDIYCFTGRRWRKLAGLVEELVPPEQTPREVAADHDIARELAEERAIRQQQRIRQKEEQEENRRLKARMRELEEMVAREERKEKKKSATFKLEGGRFIKRRKKTS